MYIVNDCYICNKIDKKVLFLLFHFYNAITYLGSNASV